MEPKRPQIVVKNSPANAGDIEMWVQSLGQEDPLEEEMATHSSILAWQIPWTKKPISMGLQRDTTEYRFIHIYKV